MQISEQQYLEFIQERDRLLKRAQSLLLQVSKRPYSIKLLRIAIHCLEGLVAYKNRPPNSQKPIVLFDNLQNMMAK